ncbi:MAG: ABC transporter ATP-binding protein [Clostridiales bacterium]|jgi:putative ABC transport system ATP-binding protein|nr:ABC transporter ATP-binding protein [Clostridiales bacterium]
MDTIITVDNVYKSFGKGDLEVKVLEGADMTIQKGEFVSLMGPSGSGKSTLLYLIGGLDRDFKGDIVVCGQSIGSLKENALSDMRLNKVGFIFQFYNLIQNLTVEDNILLPLKVAGRYDEKAKSRLNEILDITEISDKRKVMPAKLSGGQQQRVAIARALIGEPEIILADEPTGNLDKASGENIMELFRKINKEKNMTILQVTHSEKNSEYGTRIVRLDNGKLIG